jgi:hypothetical protein
LPFDSRDFESLFIKNKVYDELDSYLNNISQQQGKFWVTSRGSGYGKSTMLNYIMRRLLKDFSKLRALPILIHVGGAESEQQVYDRFVRGFVLGILDVEKNLNSVESVVPSDLLEQFSKYRPQIEDLRGRISVTSTEAPEVWFGKAFEVISDWLQASSVSKVAVLVDELDKLTEQASAFLSARQEMFEHLDNDLKAVAFFSGEESWVNRLHAGTEYTFYQGKVFLNPQLLDNGDVRSLIESRLSHNPPYMRPQDSPWTDEAIDELRQVTKGQPRKILNQASRMMNEAAARRLQHIGQGFVRAVVASLALPEVRKYLEAKAGTYEKLAKTREAGRFDLLVIFYSYSTNREIPNALDEDQDSRTRDLQVEMNDKQWKDAIEFLLRTECIVNKKFSRKLADDVVAFFAFVEEKEIDVAILPSLLDQISVKPGMSGPLAKPDFTEALARPFQNSPDTWFDEDRWFDWFYDKDEVSSYFKRQHPDNPQGAAKRAFEGRAETYLKQNDASLMRFAEDGKVLYRTRPDSVDDLMYQDLLSFGSRSIVDKYIELMQAMGSTSSIVDASRNLLSDMLAIVAKRVDVDVPEGFFADRDVRLRFYDSIRLPRASDKSLESYLDSLVDTSRGAPLVKTHFMVMVQALAAHLRNLQPSINEQLILPGREYANRQLVKAWLGKAVGEIMIIDRHLAEEGIELLYDALHRTGESRAKKLRVLVSGLVASDTARRDYLAFKSEMKRYGMEVEFRVLDPQDDVDTHDRYTLFGIDGTWACFNHPPYNIMPRKLGNIKPVESIASIYEEYWGRASKLENVRPPNIGSP